MIEVVVAKNRIHINKHQLVRTVLEQNKAIFKEDTEILWKSFQEIENQIRPGQMYGGVINGEALRKVEQLVATIEVICKKLI